MYVCRAHLVSVHVVCFSFFPFFFINFFIYFTTVIFLFSVGSVSKVNQNVLTKMDTAVGPLAFLKKCMDEKLRAKVGLFDQRWRMMLKKTLPYGL